jgi:4-hydroxybenzoate polyprenyltransferase
MIKFEHTIFALPFAFMGALLGSVIVFNKLPSWEQIGWIVLAMIGARSAAMGLNRLIDRTFDRMNPRTSMRAIPSGLISYKEVNLFILISFIVLFVASSQLDPLAMKLLPIAVFFLVFYSYTKRFTWLCHLILGLTIGLAPLGGWVAVTGEITWISILFYLTIALWIAGFDIIYACQDVEFDQKAGLYSIPSVFGIAVALRVARLLHVMTCVGLILLFYWTELSWIYLIGVFATYLLLIYEHLLVKPNDLSKVNVAFFTMNGFISIILFLFTWIELAVLTS